MRNELLSQDRIKAIQEELAGFFLDHVIDKAGEYHVELEFIYVLTPFFKLDVGDAE